MDRGRELGENHAGIEGRFRKPIRSCVVDLALTSNGAQQICDGNNSEVRNKGKGGGQRRSFFRKSTGGFSNLAPTA